MNALPLKRLVRIGSSKKDLKDFPREVRGEIGRALYLAQIGLKPHAAKPLKGFRGASVLEIGSDYQTDTYRAIYTVQFGDAIYVLHAFQKKSKTGRATPKLELNMIGERLRQAKLMHEVGERK